MPNEAFYQKYRSQTFDEVVGQPYVVRSIQNAIKNRNIGHAYLFCGPRGTGKTTMARLLARAVNCENPEKAPCGECDNCKSALAQSHPDIVEINAANETHVEDVRELIDRSQLAPMMGKYKIYIVDEVHQLSSSAASALLKTLEEPPEHVIFVLATTDPQKLLNTIISRCQRFDFSKVGVEQIKNHLIHVAEKEGIKIEENAAEKIAQLAEGGMRDALSMLEQATSYSNKDIKEEDINEIYGLASTSEKIQLIQNIYEKDLGALLQRVEEYETRGIDVKRLTSDLINALKDSVIFSHTKKESLMRTLTEKQAQQIEQMASTKKRIQLIDEFMHAYDLYRTAQSSTSIFEVVCMKQMEEDEETPQVTATPKKTKEAKKPVEEEEEVFVLPEELPEEEVVKETPKPKKKIVTQEHTIEEIVSLLVQCDKTSKQEDTEAFERMKRIGEMGRSLGLLQEMSIQASGKDCILLTTQSGAVYTQANDQETNEELYWYVKDNAHIDKMVYVLTEEIYKEAVQEFIERRKAGTLPEAMKVKRYEREEKGETLDPEGKLKELFGDDGLLEVVEE